MSMTPSKLELIGRDAFDEADKQFGRRRRETLAPPVPAFKKELEYHRDQPQQYHCPPHQYHHQPLQYHCPQQYDTYYPTKAPVFPERVVTAPPQQTLLYQPAFSPYAKSPGHMYYYYNAQFPANRRAALVEEDLMKNDKVAPVVTTRVTEFLWFTQGF